MTVAGTDDLLLAALAGDRDGAASGRTLSELVDMLDVSSDRLSGQIEFATALEELSEDGLVERERDANDGDGGTDAAFVLTNAGAKRATTVRERLAATPTELVDGETRRELSLSAAAADLDRSLVEIAADVAADGVYYREDAPAVDRVVGREAEQERFRTLLEDVHEHDRGQAVFLIGPGGVGKTTLAETLLADAREEFGVTVARVRCQDSGDPYQPLRDLLATLEPDAAPFADTGVAAEDPDELQARRTGLFYDLTALFEPAAGEPPRVVFLDDLHLADPGTMAYLASLRDQLSDRRLVVVGSYRPEELPEDAPVATANVPPEAPVTHFRLGSLDREGTRGVVECVLERRGAPEAFVDAVHERTGGNPLFVEETVKRLLEANQLDPRFEWYPDEPDAIDVPDAVMETIEERVAALDADARAILRWAALVGERVHVDVLRSVCDLPATRFETLLEALVGADVFDRDRDSDGEAITFRSQVVCEALREDLPESKRRECHGTIAAALENFDRGPAPDSIDGADGDDPDRDDGVDVSTTDRAATIAAHHENAGNEARAIAWYRRAGERATDVYAHEAAIDHYHSALALARDGADRDTLFDVCERLAEIHQTIGDYERARRHLEFVRERTTDPGRRQYVYRQFSELHKATADLERALSFTEDGLALADDPDAADEVTCALLRVRGGTLSKLGRYDEALETFERQADLADEVDDEKHRIKAVLEMGLTWYEKGDLERAEPLMREALERARSADHPGILASASNNLGLLHEHRNDYEAALTCYERARDHHEEIGDVRAAAINAINIGVICWKRGDVERALEHLEAALETARRIADEYMLTSVLQNVASLRRQQGELDACLETLATAREYALESGTPKRLAQAKCSEAWTHYYEGSVDEAADAVDRTLEIARENDNEGLLVRGLTVRGALARHAGDVGAAVDHHLEAIALANENGLDERVLTNRIELVLDHAARNDAEDALEEAEKIESLANEYDTETVALARGVASRLAGDHATAADALETALAESRAKDDRLTAFRVREQQARLALACGNLDRARDLATALRDDAEERGLGLFVERAADVLEACP